LPKHRPLTAAQRGRGVTKGMGPTCPLADRFTATAITASSTHTEATAAAARAARDRVGMWLAAASIVLYMSPTSLRVTTQDRNKRNRQKWSL